MQHYFVYDEVIKILSSYGGNHEKSCPVGHDAL